MEAKDRDKTCARSLKETEVEQRQNTLLEFQAHVKELKRLTKLVDDFTASDQASESDRVTAQIEEGGPND